MPCDDVPGTGKFRGTGKQDTESKHGEAPVHDIASIAEFFVSHYGEAALSKLLSTAAYLADRNPAVGADKLSRSADPAHGLVSSPDECMDESRGD